MERMRERLQAAYLQENGPALLLGSNSGFAQEEVIASQVGMLRVNRIPGVLPMRTELFDGRYRFRYDLSGKRTLSAALRTYQGTDSGVRSWLLQLLLTIRKGTEYLLDEEGFVLLPEYIWIERGSGLDSVYLLYAPLRRKEETLGLWEMWNELYRGLLANGVSRTAIEAVNPFRWNAETFALQLLIDALEAAETATKPKEACVDVEPEQEAAQASELAEDGETMRFAKPQLLHRGRLSAILCAICFLAFLATWEWVWLAVAIGSLGVFAWSSSVRRKAFAIRRKEQNREVAPALEIEDIGSKSEPSPILSALNVVTEGTTFLSPRADETVLLGSSADFGMKEVACLEVVRNGEKEGSRVQLTEPSFFIGRGPQGVHVIADQPSVSRVHVEIRREAGGFIAVDVGSKNGTFLNSELMIAFQPYPLSSGDTIRLPGLQLVYHI
jgi:hypothetical protein